MAGTEVRAHGVDGDNGHSEVVPPGGRSRHPGQHLPGRDGGADAPVPCRLADVFEVHLGDRYEYVTLSTVPFTVVDGSMVRESQMHLIDHGPFAKPASLQHERVPGRLTACRSSSSHTSPDSETRQSP